MTMTTLKQRDQDEWAMLRTLGKRIRLARVDAELSQEQLADRAGISRNFISSIERGAHGVDVTRLYRIAAALNRNISALLPANNAEADRTATTLRTAGQRA